ncbi:MAG: fibronectin type III domain-containing protein, partial [Aureliella sp.]
MLASDLSSAPAAGEGPALYMDVSQALVFQSRDAGGLTTLKSINPTESSATPTSLSLAGMPAGASVSEPEWSPNGNWLLFAQEGSQQLYVLNSFDGRLLPVVDSNAAPIVGLNPTWAGDSSTIGWAGPARFGGSIPNLDIMEGTLQFYQDHALLVGQTNLTDSPAAEFRPDWSPDGTKLVYDSSASGAGDLYLMDFAAKIGQRHPTMNLTADRPTTSESEADFSPDGTHIVFRSSQGNVDLWVMNVDGSGKTQLTNTPGDELAPTWSPDGSKIAYSLRTLADGVSSQDIYMMNADGSGSEQLTFTAASESCPTWRKSTALPSDVSIEISGPANVTEKESFEYTITVGNTGLVAATDVTVTLEADARMALESAVGGAIQDGQAVFHIPALAMGATVHYTVRAHTIVPGTMLVDATVSLPTDSDPVPQNNFASWMLNARPANDDFANASVLPSGRGSLPFATFNATAQANILGQPEPAHAFNSNGAPIFSSNTIWYRWFAGAAGHATFTTAGSNFDTVLAAYYITNANGVPKLQQVASNDDADSSTSKIEFDAFKDESYYIAVGGFQSTRGTGYLSWSNTPQVIPAPQPQHIFSLSRPSTLVGNAPLDLRLLGSGFDGASRVYVLDDYESPNAIQFRAHNFLTTTFRSNGHELETQLPARYLARPGTLRIVAVRNNEISNVVELHVTANEVLPAGSSVALGKVRALADVILHQAAAGAGEGETGVEVYKLEGHVNFNKYLSVDGASIELQIDRAANSMRVRIQEGSILLTNVPRYNTITLWRGADFEFTLDGEGELTNLLRATVETPLRDKGIEVGIDRAHLLLGTTLDQAGRPIYGIEIFGSLKFQQIAGLVNVPLQFQKLVLTQNDGLRFSGEIGPINFSIGGLVQLQEAYLSFQAGATPQEDSFRGRAKIATAVLSASGSVELKNGVINSVSGGLDLPALTGLPLGPLNITGGSLGLENLLTPESLQVRIGANATIAHPAVAKVISLHDVGIYYRLPAAFGGDGSLQIFQVPAASASLDLDLSANHYTFGGQVDLLPSFPIFEVRGELTASLGGSQGLNLSGYAEGIVQIPDGNGGLYDVLKACGHVAGFEFGPCLKFPMEIASAKLSYQNNAFSFSTNLPIVGKTALRIKQVQNGVQAAIDLFHNIPGIATHYVFGAGGEGEILDNTIGTFAMPADSPKLIVSVSATDAAPLYDLIDPAGNRYTPLTIGTIGGTFFQNTETNGSFYVIDNPMAGQWTAEAQIGVTGPLDFQAWGANAAPELSDVAVQASGDGYQISYVATDKDDDPRVSLYYTTSPTATNGTLIAEDMLASQTQSFFWDAAGTDVPSGTYYIYAMIDDGLNTPVALFAPEPVTVSNPLAPATPIVTSLLAVENAIDVQWQPVYASDLAGYQVWYGLQDGDQVNYTGHVDAGQSTSFRLKGLEPGKTYAVSVVAYDSSQEEDPLNPGT